MAVTPQQTPGQFGAPPPDAPREVTHAEDPAAQAMRARMAQQNERQLQPLVFTQKTPPPGVKVAATVTVPPSASRLRMPGAVKPSIAIPAETVPAPAIILTDTQQTPTQQAPVERPAVDPSTAAHLASPLAAAARKLQEQRQLTHQPAASNTDSPSRGVPTPSADPGKQITGGFGDAGDAQYFPLDGSELRELVRGLMSVIDEQLTNDLRFSMALVYPRVAARVIVEVTAYAAGGDGGQYDPSFTITKVMPPHEKTPLEVARDRADQCVFVVVADKVEMSAEGASIAPPNQIREELGLNVPRKQAVSTPTGRVIVDLRA